MKRFLIFYFLLLVSYCSFAQGVGIGTATPDPSAVLDITSTNKGLLIPRMSIASINAIGNPAKGLLVYDSVSNLLMVNVGLPAVPNWQPLTSSNASGWSLTGNTGINAANQFLGTTDTQPLRFRINNIQAGELNPLTGNIFLGTSAGKNNTAGFSNVAVGTGALKLNATPSNLVAIGDSALFHNDENNPVPGAFAFSNTAIGSKSLFSNTIGSANTATGTNSLFSNVDGAENSAYGVGALFFNKSGGLNTAVGVGALFSNTSGNENTATGWQSLHANTTGVFNTAFGAVSLNANTIGNNNTATGFGSLNFNTSGNDNTATGTRSLFSNTTGNNNTSIGSQSLFTNVNGNRNTAAGNESLFFNTTGDDNVAFGWHSLFSNTSGLGNTAAGEGSLSSNTTGGVNTAIGNLALGNSTIANNNTAVGTQSLFLNLTGNSNTAVGNNALSATIGSSSNTVLGFDAAFSFNLGSNNTIIGANADGNQNGLSNATAIGSGAIVNASNKIRLGNSAVTVIEGQVPFTTPSDGRFKYNIKEDVMGLDFIMQLRPVTYQFDVKRFDQQQVKDGKPVIGMMQASYDEAAAIRRTGFIAQEVEKAANASGYDFSGIITPKTETDHYSLSYESFVVPLVKAMQEQQRMIEELEKQNAGLQKRVLALEKNKSMNAGQK